MSVVYKNEQKNLQELDINPITNLKDENNKENMKDRIMNTEPNHCLYTRKQNRLELDKGVISKLIFNSFNDPDNYFSMESPVHVGKRIHLKKIDVVIRKEGRRFSNIKNQQSKKQTVSSAKSLSGDTNKSMSMNYKRKSVTNNNFEYIDNNSLKNIFENFKKLKIHNKLMKDNEISISRSVNRNKSNIDENNSNHKTTNPNESNDIAYPYDLYHFLDYQNKQISANKNNEKRVIALSKFLSKRINQKEDELLINKIDLFKYKKEMIKEIAGTKPKDEKFGKFQWNMDLRHYRREPGRRQLYVNVNSDRNPFWGVIVDRYPDHKERAVRPGYNLNQKEFLKFEKNMKKSKLKYSSRNYRNLDDLNVKGDNLFNVEYQREMSTKGRKILHKVFVENGKVVLDRDINRLYGEETLYKSYENRKVYSYNENSINNSERKNSHYKRDNKSLLLSPFSKSLEKSQNLQNV